MSRRGADVDPPGATLPLGSATVFHSYIHICEEDWVEGPSSLDRSVWNYLELPPFPTPAPPCLPVVCIPSKTFGKKSFFQQHMLGGFLRTIVVCIGNVSAYSGRSGFWGICSCGMFCE